MSRVLLDNSVIQRAPRDETVASAVRLLSDRGHVLCSSAVSCLEAGYSARSRREHDEVLRRLTQSFVLLPLVTAVGEVAAQLQSAMFAVGVGRAVGVVDLLHAATAIVHDAVVVHYDADFEHIAKVDSRFRQVWIVPAGSVD